MPENLDDIALRSEAVQDVLTRVPHWMIRWGSLLFLCLTLLILALGWLIKYPDIITAEAILTTEIPPQKEYARTTGMINTLYVSDNETVTKNTVLAILENTANYNDVYHLKSILDTIKLNQNNLSFPFDKLPILFLGDIESDFSQFENSYFQYNVNKDLNPFSTTVSANKVSMNELHRRLESLIVQRDLGRSEMNFKKKDLERSKRLFEKGIIAAQDFDNKQLAYITAQKNFQNLDISISQLKESIGNAENTSKRTEYSKTREEIKLLKNVLQAFNQLKKSVKEWELKYVLKSNINGTVSFFNYWTTNQTVQRGDLVFTIIPQLNSPYVAKLKTPKANSGKIRPGQKVNLSLYDYPEYEFGVVRGTVTSISRTSDQEGAYMVNVAIPKNLVSSFGKPIAFKQEMKGSANIITEDLRLLERFFYQFRAAFSRS